jgi:DNA-binding SARP family transcriptional activator/tetratricopeptide (TPR) repeat protein
VTLKRNPSALRKIVVAAAGYGKTTTLDSEAPRDGRLLRAADLVGSALPDVPWFGVDDLHELGPDDQRAVLDQLGTLPPRAGYTVTSRRPLPAALAGSLRGQVFERGPQDLAIGTHAISVLLAQEYGVLDPAAAGQVFALTAGWPALVHFAADALAHRPELDLADALTLPGTPAAGWIGANVLPDLSPEAQQLLTLAAALGPVTQELFDDLARLGPLGPVDGVVGQLRRVGLLVPRLRPGGADQLFVVPALAGALTRADGAPQPDHRVLEAAAWRFENAGLHLPAARAWQRSGRNDQVERLVVQHGADMLCQGYAAGVVELLGADDSLDGEPLVRRVHADALRMAGDNPAALRTYAPLVERAAQDGWDAALATGLATMDYARGEPRHALEVLDRVRPQDVGDDPPGIAWRACRVQVLATLGRDDEARELSVRTLQLAELGGTPGAVAEAHAAAARISVGSQKEAHHERALQAAARAGDALTAIRVLVNHSCLLLAAARYGEACVAAREAVRLAEIGSPPGRFAVALHNLGEALMRVGAYPEAMWQLQRSVAMFRMLGPGRCAMGLVGIAGIHYELGHDEQSRAAYQEAVDLGRETGELQVLVPSLAGLARLQVAARPDDALALAEEAVRLAGPALLPFALTALGWVRLARAEGDAATRWAAEAVASARAVRALDVLADALELTAAAADDPHSARRALTEALAIWQDGGAQVASWRVQVLLGWLADADGADRSRAREAGRRLQRLGILRVNGRPVTDDSTGQLVSVRVLGGFQVNIQGDPVPLTAWRSRQARSLLKVLAARRGRPLTRAYLCELLWPDDDPAKTGHRLSVLLATIRGVLDPDKDWPPDHYVGADLRGLWLDLRHVALDADSLLRDADLAAELMDDGDSERAREILTDIDARYRGGAFEDEPGEEWADGFREEVRAAWLRSLRRLAWLHSRSGRPGDAQVLLVRLLDADPYDAQIHGLLVRTLVRWGRHGEARRAFSRWADAMDAVDAPRPDQAVLA